MHAHLSSIYAATTLALLLSVAPASAEVLSFSADLTGAAEVPPNESTGTGRVVADFDTDTGMLTWSISYRGLTGPATAAHFHGPANPNETADPVLPVDLALATTGPEPEAPPDAGPVVPAEPAAEPAEPPAAEPPEELTEEPAQSPAEQAPVEPPAAEAMEEPTEEPAEPPAPDVEPAPEPQPGTPTEPTTQVSGEARLTDEQAADLRAGLWYLNIHTTMYPDGELRGQLPPEPEDD
jgi:outer membrane biosynthesis protein TonB